MKRKSIGLFAIILTALTTTVGVLMRWYLLKNVMVARGIAQDGNYFPLAMAIAVVVFLIGIAIFTGYMENRPGYMENFGVVDRRLFLTLTVCGGLIAMTGVMQLGEPQTALEKANFYMCILGGLTFAVFSIFQTLGRRPHVLLLLPLCIFTVMQLICDYRMWSGDPLLLDYCYTLLADIVFMLAVFHLGGFCFDRGKRRITAFWCGSGIVLNAISLVDATYSNTLSDIIYRAALLLMLLVLMGIFCIDTRKSED